MPQRGELGDQSLHVNSLNFFPLGLAAVGFEPAAEVAEDFLDGFTAQRAAGNTVASRESRPIRGRGVRTCKVLENRIQRVRLAGGEEPMPHAGIEVFESYRRPRGSPRSAAAAAPAGTRGPVPGSGPGLRHRPHSPPLRELYTDRLRSMLPPEEERNVEIERIGAGRKHRLDFVQQLAVLAAVELSGQFLRDQQQAADALQRFPRGPPFAADSSQSEPALADSSGSVRRAVRRFSPRASSSASPPEPAANDRILLRLIQAWQRLRAGLRSFWETSSGRGYSRPLISKLA